MPLLLLLDDAHRLVEEDCAAGEVRFPEEGGQRLAEFALEGLRVHFEVFEGLPGEDHLVVAGDFLLDEVMQCGRILDVLIRAQGERFGDERDGLFGQLHEIIRVSADELFHCFIAVAFQKAADEVHAKAASLLSIDVRGEDLASVRVVGGLPEVAGD